MSRRHHGGRPHRANGHARPAPLPPGSAAAFAPSGTTASAGSTAPADAPPPRSDPPPLAPEGDLAGPSDVATATPHVEGGPGHDGRPPASNGVNGSHAQHDSAAPNGSNGASHEPAFGASCTAPQLRRFIKSRPYVPMHELRRRFGIDGGEDDVTPVDLGSGRVFVGLPRREGMLLGELLRGGEIGYELSMDPRSPVVVGLYPMRPVARG